MKAYLALLLLALNALYIAGIKIDCENTESINEDNIHYCCKHPDGHSDVFEECAKKTGFKWTHKNEEAIVDLTADRAIAGTCFGKCVFTKFNFMKGDQLDMEAVKKFYSTSHKDDPEYVKEMINAFDHCHGKAEEDTAKFLSTPIFKDMSKEFCEPKASVIIACVIREFFHNCPADRWSKTDECQKTLEFSKQCKDSLATI